MDVRIKDEMLRFVIHKDDVNESIRVGENDRIIVVDVPLEEAIMAFAEAMIELDRKGQLEEVVGGWIQARAVLSWAKGQV